MARKPTKTIDVNGLSVNDILQLNVSSFRGVSTANVKQVTSRLVSAMNKRIARMGKSEIGRMSPTYQAFERRGKYSVKGLTRESTLQVFRNLQESFHKATSLKEWKKERAEMLEKIDLSFLKDDIETERKFWKMYHEFESEDKRIQNIKGVSSQVLAIMKKKFMKSDNPSKRSIKWNITHEYNEMQKRLNQQRRGRSTSSFFEDDGNE